MITGLQLHKDRNFLTLDKKQFKASLTARKHTGVTPHLQWLIMLTAPFCRQPVIALGKKAGVGEGEETGNSLQSIFIDFIDWPH